MAQMAITMGTPTADAPVKLRRKGFNGMPLILLAPAVLILCILTGYPIMRLVVNSFQQYGRAQLMGVTPEWVGLGNFKTVLSDPSFWLVFLRSFVFMLAAVFFTIAFGTLIAILLTKLNRGFRLLLSVGLLLAWAVPPLTATIVMGWIIDRDYGILNYVLSQLTGSNWLGHNWLDNPFSFFVVLTIIIVWQGIPFIAFTMYAALTGVPAELIEAGAIDQAGPVKRFFLIQLPYIRAVLAVLVVLSVIWDLNVFAQIYALQGIGGIAERTNTLGVWIYAQGSASGSIGLSAAAAVVMVTLMLTISLAYVRQTLKEGEVT